MTNYNILVTSFFFLIDQYVIFDALIWNTKNNYDYNERWLRSDDIKLSFVCINMYNVYHIIILKCKCKVFVQFIDDVIDYGGKAMSIWLTHEFKIKEFFY